MPGLSFARKAVDDIDEAVAWYSQFSPALARRFSADVTAAVERIQGAPLAWPPLGADRRHCLLTHFPYSVVYRTDGQELHVVAVVHHRRRPAIRQSRR